MPELAFRAATLSILATTQEVEKQRQAVEAHTAALNVLRGEIKRRNAIAQISLREAQRALADVISGQIGAYGGVSGYALIRSNWVERFLGRFLACYAIWKVVTS